MAYGKEEGFTEGRDEVAEVSPPKLVLSLSSQPEYPRILYENAGLEHVINDCTTFSLRHSVNDIPEPTTDVWSRNAAQLE